MPLPVLPVSAFSKTLSLPTVALIDKLLPSEI